MRVRNVQRYGEQPIELQMTPMIDVVFLLLVFFLLTFQIVSPEGDFGIKMPQAAPSEGLPDDRQLPPIKVTLRAAGNGELAGIQMGKRSLSSFDELRLQIRGIVDDVGGPGSAGARSTEVELDCDYHLKFEYVMDAITAVSGYIDEGQIVKVIEKIRFSPPRAP